MAARLVDFLRATTGQPLARWTDDQQLPVNLPEIDLATLESARNADPEDNQRGVDDPVNELASGALTTEIVQTWRARVKLNDQLFPGGFTISEVTPWASLAFRLPDNQRASIALRFNLPRDMNVAVNPEQFRFHTLYVIIPAVRARTVRYTAIDEHDDCQPFDLTDPVMFNTVGEFRSSALYHITTTDAYITGAALPALITEEISVAARNLINSVRTLTEDAETVLTFDLLLHTADDDSTERLAARFATSMAAQRGNDPDRVWIRDSPNAETFEMGNIVNQSSRPAIGPQRAEIVFLDKKAYMIPHIYGNLIEDEYQEMNINELAATAQQMILIESPIAVNPQDNPEGNSFLSTARAYFAFLNFNESELLRPEVGTRLTITSRGHHKNPKTRRQMRANNLTRSSITCAMPTRNPTKNAIIGFVLMSWATRRNLMCTMMRLAMIKPTTGLLQFLTRQKSHHEASLQDVFNAVASPAFEVLVMNAPSLIHLSQPSTIGSRSLLSTLQISSQPVHTSQSTREPHIATKVSKTKFVAPTPCGIASTRRNSAFAQLCSVITQTNPPYTVSTSSHLRVLLS